MLDPTSSFGADSDGCFCRNSGRWPCRQPCLDAHNVSMPTKNSRSVPVASRVNRFSYAIRNIVAEAKAVEAQGKAVRYLNIGDPVAFGFATPPHLVETVVRAMRDGHNGYLASAGILAAREAVADDYRARGVDVTPERV